MMARKTYKNPLCLFYILILFLWNICSEASSVSEIADAVCSTQNCYVNHSSAIISISERIPAQKYLSARDSGTVETLSAARKSSVKTLSRTIKQIATHLFPNNLSADRHALSGLFLTHKIPSHDLCGIIVANYIHRQDGQK